MRGDTRGHVDVPRRLEEALDNLRYMSIEPVQRLGLPVGVLSSGMVPGRMLVGVFGQGVGCSLGPRAATRSMKDGCALLMSACYYVV